MKATHGYSELCMVRIIEAGLYIIIIRLIIDDVEDYNLPKPMDS